MHVAVPVLDLDESIVFYEQLLGLELGAHDESGAHMYVGRSRISLRVTTRDSRSLQRDGRDEVRSRHFGLRVPRRSDVDELADALRQARIDAVSGPEDRADGRAVFFCDPSGNQIEVYFEDSAVTGR
jgi:catechol-2,3-dioxygenase